jgi:hypothetical protein
MIKVKAVKVNGVLTPERNEDKGFGNHCDGDYFFFFESDDDKQLFFNFETENF